MSAGRAVPVPDAAGPADGREFGIAYRRALAQHVRTPGERTLTQAYDLGRAAIALDLAILEIAAAHHDGLRELLPAAPPAAVGETVGRAGDFLSEALTAYEMVRRSFLALRETERQQRHHAAVIRRLSALFADTSLADDGRQSVAEVLQLVVEHARELTQAARCAAQLTSADWPGSLHAVAEDDAAGRPRSAPDLEVGLTSLDGSRLGSISLWAETSGAFSELDQALVVHLAQMASAALDRATLFAGSGA